ncbi:MAG TPA: RsmG family class I SAM-dependent methyltransferase [Bdellovibrionales bacterium]|nr:RsmG family class I SAM-dependent methyltransferase [Bdellovibrionales bacterium]
MNKNPSGTPKNGEEPAVEAVFVPEVSAARYEKWFPQLSAEAREKLLTYHSELIKFNRTINLISPGTAKSADATHFADAVLASEEIQKHLIPDAPLYDFGSGNGIPGLVFGLLYPQVKVVLVDRDQRKLEFCKHIAATLKLTNVSTHVGGVEELPSGSIKNAVARGFAPLSKALLLTRKPLAKGGRFFHMKGDGWANELAQVPSQLFSVWSPSLLAQYRIPDSNAEMGVVLTEKIGD